MYPTRLVFFALSAVLTLTPLHAQSWHVATTFHPGGEGGWDYVTVDAPNHRLFVTRATHTQAIDTRTGKLLADIPGQVRSHGVALVPKLNRGFITDGGGSGAILVFDLKTYQVLGRIQTMPDSDGIIYDPSTDLVLVVSGDGNALMTFHPDIDLHNGKITTIALAAPPNSSPPTAPAKPISISKTRTWWPSSISTPAKSSTAGRLLRVDTRLAWPLIPPPTASSSAAAVPQR